MTAHVAPMSTPIDIVALDNLAATATRGPWRWEQFRYGPPTLTGRAGEAGVYEYDSEVLEVSHDGGCGCRANCTLNVEISDADKAFIAAASPEVVQALIERLQSAEASIARLRDLAPTWPRGMYGAPDDMYSKVAIERAFEASTPSA